MNSGEFRSRLLLGLVAFVPTLLLAAPPSTEDPEVQRMMEELDRELAPARQEYARESLKLVRKAFGNLDHIDERSDDDLNFMISIVSQIHGAATACENPKLAESLSASMRDFFMTHPGVNPGKVGAIMRRHHALAESESEGLRELNPNGPACGDWRSFGERAVLRLDEMTLNH